MSKKIDSLQALRAIAFIGIFLGHSRAPVYWTSLGVSIFFVLSGFLMELKNLNQIAKNDSFSIYGGLHRIKKIYPLHITTMIAAVILAVIRWQWLLTVYPYADSFKQFVSKLVAKIALNVTLLQSWVPKSDINVSLNGVAWYLSTTMFLYIVFPFIDSFVKKRKLSSLWSILIAGLMSQVLLCTFMISVLGSDSHTYIWFMYVFPLFRLVDFFGGCVLARSYGQRLDLISNGDFNVSWGKDTKKTSGDTGAKNSPMVVQATAIELIVVIWAIAIVFLGRYFSSMTEAGAGTFVKALFNETTLYIPVAMALVYCFTTCKGFITKLLSNKVLIEIGNLSSNAFLIHYMVTEYVHFYIEKNDIVVAGNVLLALIIAEFAVTMAISKFWQKFALMRH